MKKLNITKETFEKSKYFTGKYGKLAFVSESGNLYKTNKGKILKFAKESTFNDGIANDEEYTFLRVSVAWDISDVEDSTLPTSVFIKVPTYIYEGDGEMNLSGMIEDYFGYPIDDISPSVADERDKKHVKDWLLWTDDEGLVEDDGVGMRYNEGMKREVMPMNGRKSFGHKAIEEEDDDGFTLFSYETPVARLERRDDGSGLDFTLLNDYLSTTTLTHIHSWLLGHNQQDIPTKKLLQMNVGDSVPMVSEESKKVVKENWVRPGKGLGKGDFDIVAVQEILDGLKNDSWHWTEWQEDVGGWLLKLNDGLKKPGLFSSRKDKNSWKTVKSDEQEIKDSTNEAIDQFCKQEIGEDVFPHIESFMGHEKEWREYPGSEWDTILAIYQKEDIKLPEQNDSEDDLSMARYMPMIAHGMHESRKLVKEGWKRYPAANGCTIHDCGDCFVVTNKNGTTIGQCRSMIEAETIAEQAKDDDRRMFNEGAGAGYTVKIKDLKLGKVIAKKLVKGEKSYEDYYECKVEVLPCECEIGAEDYYNDFFWQEHEFGETPRAQIDGGVATIEYLPDSYTNADDAENDPEMQDIFEREIDRNLGNRKLDISFSYGWGWVHVDLPREKMELTDVDVDNKYMDIAIKNLELNAPDLADAVNCGYQSTYDRDEEDEEDEDEELVDESYEHGKDDGRKKIMNALEEFRQVLWDDTKVDDDDDHDLRRAWFERADKAISTAIQTYFKYTRI